MFLPSPLIQIPQLESDEAVIFIHPPGESLVLSVVNPTALDDYMVGHILNPNQATFKESVQAIIKKLGTDTLLCITPAKVTNLQTLLDAYTALAANPDSQQSDATTERRQRDAQIASITDRRITIQFAADAEWPYTVDTNAGIRSEFYLPASQPFHG